jgi:hypothetical protein
MQEEFYIFYKILSNLESCAKISLDKEDCHHVHHGNASRSPGSRKLKGSIAENPRNDGQDRWRLQGLDY